MGDTTSSASGRTSSSMRATSAYTRPTPKASARILALASSGSQIATTSTCGRRRHPARWSPLANPAPATATRNVDVGVMLAAPDLGRRLWD
jgi:hypothetical protein